MSLRNIKIRGFTLIELMIVISIISLLGSVVLVSLQGARLKAFNTKYSQEIISLQKAIILYDSTYGDPPPCTQPNPWECYAGLAVSSLQPLLTSGVISKIPGYDWPDASLSHKDKRPWADLYYRPNFTDVNGYTEMSCGQIQYADLNPGTLPGVLVVVSNQALSLPDVGYSVCSQLSAECQFNQSGQGTYEWVYSYCLPITY